MCLCAYKVYYIHIHIYTNSIGMLNTNCNYHVCTITPEKATAPAARFVEGEEMNGLGCNGMVDAWIGARNGNIEHALACRARIVRTMFSRRPSSDITFLSPPIQVSSVLYRWLLPVGQRAIGGRLAIASYTGRGCSGCS